MENVIITLKSRIKYFEAEVNRENLKPNKHKTARLNKGIKDHKKAIDIIQNL